MSDYGELAPVAVQLIDWLTVQFRLKCETTPNRADGCKIPDLVRDYRFRLQLGLQLALAAGCGEMLHRAGRPWR